MRESLQSANYMSSVRITIYIATHTIYVVCVLSGRPYGLKSFLNDR